EGLWTLVSGSNSVTFQDQTVGNTRVTNLGQGENTLRWTITNGNCVSSDEVIITNDNPTQADAGRDKSICVDSFRLNGNEAVIGDGSWSVINGYGDVVDSSDHSSMVQNLGKGGNVLRWTIDHNGCISYDEVEISNDMIEAEAGYDQSLCLDSTSLSANNPGRGEGYWSVVMGSAAFEDATNPNTQVNNLDHRSENILKWTITNQACVSTDEVVVKNNSPGIVYAGVDDDVCDDSYYLKANPNYLGKGKWEALSGGATIDNDSSASTKVWDMGLGRNTFRWSVRRNGCVLHDDITIYNNLPVESYAGENDTTCTNEYVLHAEEPPFGQGQWTIVAGSGEFEDAGVFNTTVSNLSQGANTFKWTVYNGSCSTEDEVTIVVNKPNTPRAGADQEICADSTTLQANMPGSGQSGQWEVVEGSGSFEDPSDPNSKVTHMGYGKNTFRWSIRYKNCSLYDEVTITNNMPTKAYAGQDIHVCGSQVRLDAVEATIGEGRWSLVSGQASFSDQANPDPLVSNLGFGPNTLRWTTTNGTCTSLDEVTVYNDKATAYAGVDQEVYRDSTTLVASSVTRGEGKWIILGGSGTFDNPGSSQTKVRDLSGGVNTFRWTINNNGCITSDEVSITYYEMPDPEFSVSTASGCPPLSVQFFNESLKVNSNFTWEFGDGNTSTNENPRHTFYHPGEYQVQLKTKGPDGSTVTEDTSIFVREVPHASFDLAPSHLYIPEQHLQCYDLSVDADRYLWHFGDDSTSDEPSPMHLYQDTGTYDIRLEVWSKYGCYDDTTQVEAVTVDQSGRIRFPSGFTPNAHGPQGGHYNVNSRDNDVFHPIVKGVQEYHLEIFNRWGVLVFRSDKVEIGWDGYYQGKLAEEGVYIYKVHGTYNNGTRFEKVGDFVLIRR
ncbi:MAG TPA: PKD domain-containing protein, partial [Bacteroidales bacterium]|nr:PKD domain-containing protein [Bacteroidales bacterium]